MLSVSGKNWEEINIDKRILEKIKTDYNLDEIIAKIIIDRKFDQSEIYSINNSLDIQNPFRNILDFNLCYETLDKTINNKEKILIVGDYDVDGCVATSLIIKLLKKLNHKFTYYIPDRIKDGYGASLKLIKELSKKNEIKLVIMLDCGSNSHEAVNYLNQNNIKSIIIDHHEIYKPYPKTKNIINPKKDCSYNQYNYMCSSALTYFFIDFFLKKKKLKIKFETNLIYVLLALVADVMPLRKINRIIAKKVLSTFNILDNDIFREIYKLKKKNNPLNINDLGFLISPILNSSGRIGQSKLPVELLTNENSAIKKKIINDLNILNDKRKFLENNILKDIDLSLIEKENKEIIILKLSNINEGLIGIIAAKIKEYFNKPTIIFTNSGSFLKGSARSTDNFNIGKYIKLALDKNLIISGGGHNLAAGLTLENFKLEHFENFLINSFKVNQKNSNLKYISKISLNSLNINFLNKLQKLEPFGKDNSNPNFLIEDLKILKPKIIKEKYVRCVLKNLSGKSANAISFYPLQTKISQNLIYNKNKIKIIAQINQNLIGNNKSLQLTIVDVIL